MTNSPTLAGLIQAYNRTHAAYYAALQKHDNEEKVKPGSVSPKIEKLVSETSEAEDTAMLAIFRFVCTTDKERREKAKLIRDHVTPIDLEGWPEGCEALLNSFVADYGAAAA